jgi:hypothetical protein
LGFVGFCFFTAHRGKKEGKKNKKNGGQWQVSDPLYVIGRAINMVQKQPQRLRPCFVGSTEFGAKDALSAPCPLCFHLYTNMPSA